jgi:hypothetical protein
MLRWAPGSPTRARCPVFSQVEQRAAVGFIIRAGFLEPHLMGNPDCGGAA